MSLYLSSRKTTTFLTALILGLTLKGKEVNGTNQLVRTAVGEEKVVMKALRDKYNDYTDINRARIGKYTAENSIARAYEWV